MVPLRIPDKLLHPWFLSMDADSLTRYTSAIVDGVTLEPSLQLTSVDVKRGEAREDSSTEFPISVCMLSSYGSSTYPAGPKLPAGTRESAVLRCALLPRNRLCQINASDSNSSMSFSVHSLVGSACKNIRISWKFIFRSCSLHFTRNAAQTYR